MKHRMTSRMNVLAGLLLAANACIAQQFPDRPIRIVVPYAPGSVSDATIRLIGNKMEAQLGQPVIMENRPGAAAMIGATVVAQGPADGYSLLWTSPAAISKVFVKSPPFDVRTDLAPVSAMCMSAHVLAVNISLPVKTLPEFVNHVKKNPGRLNYAQSANSTMLPMEFFKQVAGLDIVGVPYKGAAPANTAIVSGEVQAIFGLLTTFRPLEAAGKVRVLAGTFPRRPPAAPDVATFSELGYPDMVFPQTTTFLARSAVPADRLTKLSGVMTGIVGLPDVAKPCIDAGGETLTIQGAPLQKHVNDEIDRWGAAAVRAKFQPTE